MTMMVNADKTKSNSAVEKTIRFRKKNQTQRAKRCRSDGLVLDLAPCDDDVATDVSDFMKWLRNPTVLSLAKLRRAIKSHNRAWMNDFLQFDGVGLLFQCLSRLTKSTHLSDMVIKLECITCLREVVNSKLGLDCLLAMKDSSATNILGPRFASALDTDNPMLKTQVFEILSAICVYSYEGFKMTLDALESYKVWKKLPYRFSLLIEQLHSQELPVFKTNVLALINAIVVASEAIHERVRIRNEFISLGVLDYTAALRREGDAALNVQCDVFEEELAADADALRMLNNDVNISNPLDVFNAILARTENTPMYASFLSILQSLFQIDYAKNKSETAWMSTERVIQSHVSGNKDTGRVTRVTSVTDLEQKDAATQTDSRNVKLSRSSGLKCKCGLGIRTSSISDGIGIVGNNNTPPTPQSAFSEGGCVPCTHSQVVAEAQNMSGGKDPPQVPPPPPPPPPAPPLQPNPLFHSIAPPPPPAAPPFPQVCISTPAAPPPPPFLASPTPNMSPRQSSSMSPMPPPPPPAGMIPGSHSPISGMLSPPQLNTIQTPDPHCKMKIVPWNKVTPTSNNNNIWKDVSSMNDGIHVKYNEIEELFGQKAVPATHSATLERQKKAGGTTPEITLIDSKKSMNVNIFLKQFRKSNEEIVELLKNADDRAFGTEKLKGLQKLLPTPDEAELLRSFEGQSAQLGNAEKFFRLLILLPSYRLLISAMILRSDFTSQMSFTRPCLASVIHACRLLYDNASLKTFLRFVLHAGNFINKGSSAGSAVGFRVGFLNKLASTKSNQANVTLLHFLVGQAQEQDPSSLKFADDLTEVLHKACRTPVDGVQSEYRAVKASFGQVKTQLSSAPDDIRNKFSEFLEEAENDIADVDESFERLSKQTTRLAEHYCENVHSFRLDEFLATFSEFCDKVKLCQQENESRKRQSENAVNRTSTKRYSGGKNAAEQDRQIVDRLVDEMKRGKVLRRLSLKKKKADPYTPSSNGTLQV